jgi:TRAP-type C4-dicarboxylate transport system permease small subunit
VSRQPQPAKTGLKPTCLHHAQGSDQDGRRIIKTIERINALSIKISLFFAGLSLIALVLLTTVNVGFRVVSQSLYGVIEIVTWFGVCINAFGLAYAQEGKDNVAVTLFTDGRSETTKNILEFIGILVGVFFAVVAIWGLYRYVGILIRTNQVSSSLHVPFWPIVAFILIGVGVFLITLITDIFRIIMKLKI